SSIFALGRTLAGPPAGYLVDAIGWTPFFLVCTAASVPGLVLLQLFVPFRAREPSLEEEGRIEPRPITRARLILTSLVWGLLGAATALLSSALLAALKTARGKPGMSLDLRTTLLRPFAPAAPSDWLRLAAFGVVGLVAAGAAAAFLAARR